jgi:arylsulfatase
MKAFFDGDWKILLMPPPFGTGEWELFNVRNDPAEMDDLSDQYPDRRAEIVAQWERYKEANGVLDVAYDLAGGH